MSALPELPSVSSTEQHKLGGSGAQVLTVLQSVGFVTQEPALGRRDLLPRTHIPTQPDGLLTVVFGSE